MSHQMNLPPSGSIRLVTAPVDAKIARYFDIEHARAAIRALMRWATVQWEPAVSFNAGWLNTKIVWRTYKITYLLKFDQFVVLDINFLDDDDTTPTDGYFCLTIGKGADFLKWDLDGDLPRCELELGSRPLASSRIVLERDDVSGPPMYPRSLTLAHLLRILESMHDDYCSKNAVIRDWCYWQSAASTTLRSIFMHLALFRDEKSHLSGAIGFASIIDDDWISLRLRDHLDPLASLEEYRLPQCALSPWDRSFDTSEVMPMSLCDYDVGLSGGTRDLIAYLANPLGSTLATDTARGSIGLSDWMMLLTSIRSAAKLETDNKIDAGAFCFADLDTVSCDHALELTVWKFRQSVAMEASGIDAIGAPIVWQAKDDEAASSHRSTLGRDTTAQGHA